MSITWAHLAVRGWREVLEALAHLALMGSANEVVIPDARLLKYDLSSPQGKWLSAPTLPVIITALFHAHLKKAVMEECVEVEPVSLRWLLGLD